MRPIRSLTTLAALTLLASCTANPVTPSVASGHPALTGGYMSSGNAFDPGTDTTSATSTAADTMTARGPGYMGSGY
jgi:uncharacterized lipoprotein YajG